MKRKLYVIISTTLMVMMFTVTSVGHATAPLKEPPPSIRLRGHTFTPTLGERPELPAGLTIPGYEGDQLGYYIVQFHGPVQQAWKDQVAALGAELIAYLPDFAFKVRMTPAEAHRVERLDSVIWVGLFQPAYKLSPNLVRDGRQLYKVRVERGADVPPVADAITRLGAWVSRRGESLLLVGVDSARLDAIAQILDVAWVETFRLREKENEYGGGVILGSDTANAAGYTGANQVVAVADTGIGHGTPEGAHRDIPPARIDAIYNWPGEDYPNCWTIVDDGAQDVDSGHGTHTSGSVLSDGAEADKGEAIGFQDGEGKGTAPDAHLVFQATENYVEFTTLCKWYFGYEDGYYLMGLPDDLGELYQQAYDAGARIHSNSWGSDAQGDYTEDAANTDHFMWSYPDMLITTSAGNSGVDADADGVVDEDSIGSPATAKNILTVGASEHDRQGHYECDESLGYTDCASQAGQNEIITYGEGWPDDFPAEPLASDPATGNAEQMAAFSSRGPTDDGRIKPDVVAPGTYVLSNYSDLYQEGYDASQNPQNGAWQYDGWGFPLNQYYKYMGGTSMSNPLVAGGAAVVREFYQESHGHAASAALVKATLINSAVDMLDENNDGVDDNAFPIPNNHEGWGRVNLADATDGSHEFVEETAGLSTDGSMTYQFEVSSSGDPFKVTLVWTDYASTETAEKNLVNDLDLVVTAPDGAQYVGNVFSAGWSTTGGSADQTNNVENVYLQSAGDGSWTVEVSGYNVPQGPQPFALVVDGVLGEPDDPPTVTITSPSEGDDVTGTIEITADASDDNGVTQVKFYVNGNSIGVDETAPYAISWDTTTVSDGSHQISATATDTIGQTDTDSVNVQVDNTAPTVTITAPAEGDYVAGTIEITADASDATSGVAQVEFFVDGSSIGVDTTAPYAVSWDTATVDDGSREISATATDNVGLTSSDEVNVTVDNTDPTVAITSPTEGETVSGTLDVTADASDATSGVRQVEFFVDGDSIGADSSEPYEVSWDTTTVSNGDHELTAVATDGAGNTATSVPVNVTVDNEADNPPTVTITSPSEGEDVTNTIEITADASDDNGVTQVEFYVEGNSIGVDETAPYAVTWDSTTVADGGHEISATATDTIGQTDTDVVNVDVDNTAPTVTITSPSEGDYVAGTIDITAEASDATSGVAQVEFFVDGYSIGVDTTAPYAVSWDSATVDDGSREISAMATDNVGLTSSDEVNVTVDNTDPTVAITSPEDGETVSGTVAVTADASDATSGVTQVEFFVDGESIGADTSEPYEVSWDTTTVSNGYHELTAVATDSAGNTATSDPVTVTVQNEVADTIHVGDLDGTSRWVYRTWVWDATVTIEVHDANHNPVADATVSGTWSGGYSGTGECTTGSDGRCSVSTDYIWRSESSTTWTVDDLTKAGFACEPADNHDPDGDSDGTTIAIQRP